MNARPLSTWFTVAGLCVFWLYLGSLSLDQARRHDFLSFYTGAWMVAHGHAVELYQPAVQLAFQHSVTHTTASLAPYIRPPFYALLLAPLGLLPFEAAFVAWIVSQIVILMGCWAWSFRRFGPEAVLVASFFMPTTLGIAHGQDCALLAALLIASYTLAAREKPLAGGAVLGVMLAKFHLILLWPVALVIQRRWKMLAGFAAVAAGEAALSLAMVGASGIRDYRAILQDRSFENLSPSPEFMLSLPGLFANLGVTRAATTIVSAAGVIAVWALAIRGAPLARLYTLTTLAGLLMVAHVYGYDASLLLLPIWLTLFLKAERPVRMGALWLATPFPYCLTLAGKPWAALASVSLLAFLAALVIPRRVPESDAIESA